MAIIPKVFLPKLNHANSPNQSQRLFPNDVEVIVCHTPEGSYAGATATLMNPNAQVSYHVLIREDGKEATQFVPWSRKAWHAKVHNSRSEGISLAGFARDKKASQPGVKVMARVVAFRLKERGLPPKWSTKRGFCRHADLQSDRSDPMTKLEWVKFVGRVKMEYHRGGFRKVWGR